MAYSPKAESAPEGAFSDARPRTVLVPRMGMRQIGYGNRVSRPGPSRGHKK
jgi:hypothetical protein